MIFVTVSSLFASCDNAGHDQPIDPDDPYSINGVVKTGSTNYSFVRIDNGLVFDQIVLDFELTNDTAKPLYMQKCSRDNPQDALPQPLLIKMQAGTWIVALGTVCDAVYIDPVTIGPGETYLSTGELISNLNSNTYPRFESEIDSIAGTYKIRLPVYTEFSADGPFVLADMKYRLSNEFQVSASE